MFVVESRYGYQSKYDENSVDVLAVVKELIDELRTEQFEKDDDEHYTVGLSREPYGISAMCSGVVSLDFFPQEGEVPYSTYMRDVPDSRLIPLMVALAKGDFETVLAAPWVQGHQLSPHSTDYYRKKKSSS